MIRWAFFWTFVTAFITGCFTYTFGDGSMLTWQAYLRFVGGLFFFVAIVSSGILISPRKGKGFVREEWSFICILVTISLFGISLFFH